MIKNPNPPSSLGITDFGFNIPWAPVLLVLKHSTIHVEIWGNLFINDGPFIYRHLIKCIRLLTSTINPTTALELKKLFNHAPSKYCFRDFLYMSNLMIIRVNSITSLSRVKIHLLSMKAKITLVKARCLDTMAACFCLRSLIHNVQ